MDYPHIRGNKHKMDNPHIRGNKHKMDYPHIRGNKHKNLFYVTRKILSFVKLI